MLGINHYAVKAGNTKNFKHVWRAREILHAKSWRFRSQLFDEVHFLFSSQDKDPAAFRTPC
jgi:hypothetical protein